MSATSSTSSTSSTTPAGSRARRLAQLDTAGGSSSGSSGNSGDISGSSGSTAGTGSSSGRSTTAGASVGAPLPLQPLAASHSSFPPYPSASAVPASNSAGSGSSVSDSSAGGSSSGNGAIQGDTTGNASSVVNSSTGAIGLPVNISRAGGEHNAPAAAGGSSSNMTVAPTLFSSSNPTANTTNTGTATANSSSAASAASSPSGPAMSAASAATPATTVVIPDNSSILAAPAELAELLARQQDELLQIHMADALAANLMTYEALSTWTTAAVSQPFAVFAMQQQMQVSAAAAAAAAQGTQAAGSSWTVTSSGAGSDGDVVPCFANWDGGGTADFGIGCCNASSGLSIAAQLADADAASGNESRVKNSSAKVLIASQRNQTCQARWGTPLNVTTSGAAHQAGPNSGPDSLTDVSGCVGSQCVFQGTVRTASLVGMSPYQLYPSLNQGGGKTGLEDTATTTEEQPQGQMPGGNSSTTVAGISGYQSQLATSSSTNSSSDNSSVLIIRGLKQAAEASNTSVPPSGQPTNGTAAAVQFVGTTPAAAAANASTQATGGVSAAPLPAVAAMSGAAANSSMNASMPPAAAAVADIANSSDGEVYIRVKADQLAYLSLLQLAELLADGRLSAQQLAAVYDNRLRR